MSSIRALRPLTRALQRQPLAFARPSYAAPLSTTAPKAVVAATPSISTQVKARNPQQQASKPVVTAQLPDYSKMTVLTAAMPQLVPFYFVNEIVATFAVLPIIIYVLSKYILPQKVRLMAARLFISKL